MIRRQGDGSPVPSAIGTDEPSPCLVPLSCVLYHSGTVLVGIGVPIPAELHGEIGYSYVYGFNLYDAIEDIYIIIMEW